MVCPSLVLRPPCAVQKLNLCAWKRKARGRGYRFALASWSVVDHAGDKEPWSKLSCFCSSMYHAVC